MPIHKVVSYELIGQIYESSSTPSNWPVVLEMIAQDIDADSITLLYREFANPASEVGYIHTNQSTEESTQMVKEYEDYYHQLDPMWRLTAERGQIGVGIADSLLGLSREEYEEQCPEEYLENHMRKYDRWYVGGCNIFYDQEKALVIAVQRGINSSPWTAEEMDYLTQLSPHFQRAFRIHREFVGLRTSVKQLQACINRLLVGLIIIRPNGKIAFTNELAERILSTNPVIANNNGILRATPAHNDNRLQKLISNMRGGDLSTDQELTETVMALSLKTDDSAAPLPMLITPIVYYGDLDQAHNTGGTYPKINNHIAIFFADPERSQQYSRDVISEFYGLTRAEAGVAIAISNGYTVSEYANKNSITENTVRTQIKHIFHKLNVSRQAEIVKVLLQTPNITPQKEIKPSTP